MIMLFSCFGIAWSILLTPLLFLCSFNIFPEFSVRREKQVYITFSPVIHCPCMRLEAWSLALCSLPLCVEWCTSDLLPLILAYPIGITCWLSSCVSAPSMTSSSCGLVISTWHQDKVIFQLWSYQASCASKHARQIEPYGGSVHWFLNMLQNNSY